MQLVMLTSRNNLTISLGVATIQAEMATNYGLIMAGAALAAVPIVTVFLVFQKSFTQGITMGAVKDNTLRKSNANYVSVTLPYLSIACG